MQPRRGKNLPEGGLDSRAKKLHREDPEDYEFSLKWINENAHVMYKDENNNVLGLRELTEVSLCKAHSSTLYRAKKRHERQHMGGPPSPSTDPYHHQNTLRSGGLAAKVREISANQQQYQPGTEPDLVIEPDFSRLTHSTSNKRKRIHNKLSPNIDTQQRPHSSVSTPLLYGRNVNPFMLENRHANNVPTIPAEYQQQYMPVVDFPSQLPPLHSRKTDTILPSASTSTQIYHHIHDTPMANTSPRPTLAIKPSTSTPMDITPTVIETVSLKPLSSPDMYYFRNLAITDSFTFRDLLAEIDMTGSPPPGKRIVISDAEKFYPLDQAIRSVIRRPNSTHLELCLGLTDKPSINWSTYS
jgi:hypothetical protein